MALAVPSRTDNSLNLRFRDSAQEIQVIMYAALKAPALAEFIASLKSNLSSSDKMRAKNSSHWSGIRCKSYDRTSRIELSQRSSARRLRFGPACLRRRSDLRLSCCAHRPFAGLLRDGFG